MNRSYCNVAIICLHKFPTWVREPWAVEVRDLWVRHDLEFPTLLDAVMPLVKNPWGGLDNLICAGARGVGGWVGGQRTDHTNAARV